MYEGFNLHLTALDFDRDNPNLRAYVKERCELNYEATKKKIALAKENGYLDGITWDDIERYNEVGSWYCVGSLVRACTTLRIPVPEDEVLRRIFKSPEAKTFSPSTPTA